MTGVARGLQNRCGALARPGWVRFPHVPAKLAAFASLAGALALGLIEASPAAAQVVREGETTAELVEEMPVPPPAADSLPPTTPFLALLRSMVLPGWGQLVVGRPQRAAFYFAAEGTFMFMALRANEKLKAAREIEEVMEDPQEDGDPRTLAESRARQRENWLVLAGFIAFLSGLDAWVSTHFWDFEPRIGLPPDGTPGLALSIPVKFP